MLRWGLAAVIGVVIRGCAGAEEAMNNRGNSGKSESAIPKAESPLVVGLFDSCPTASVGGQESAALLPIAGQLATAAISILVPPLINVATTRTADWLADLANQRNASSTGSASQFLWQMENSVARTTVGCIVAIRGHFSGTGSKHAPDSPKEKHAWTEADSEQVSYKLKQAGLPALIGHPEVYVEFELSYPTIKFPAGQQFVDDNGKASGGKLDNDITIPTEIHVRPRRVSFLKSGAKRGSTKEKKLVVDLRLDVEIKHDGKKQSLTLIQRSFDFGNRRIPSDIVDHAFLGRAPIRTVLPYPYKGAIPVVIKDDVRHLATMNLIHTTAAIVVTETEAGGDVERGIAKGLQDDASKISEPIEAYLKGLIEEAMKGKKNAAVQK